MRIQEFESVDGPDAAELPEAALPARRGFVVGLAEASWPAMRLVTLCGVRHQFAALVLDLWHDARQSLMIGWRRHGLFSLLRPLACGLTLQMNVYCDRDLAIDCCKCVRALLQGEDMIFVCLVEWEVEVGSLIEAMAAAAARRIS